MQAPNKILWLLRLLLGYSAILWLSLAFTGEGAALLTGIGAINILTLLATFTNPSSTWLWSLAMAATSSNLIIHIYQSYAAVQLLQISLSQLPLAALTIYVSGSALFSMVILRLYAHPEELYRPSTPKTSEEGRKNRG